MRIPGWARKCRVPATAAVVALVLSSCVLGTTGDGHFVPDDSATLTGRLVTNIPDATSTYWFEYGTTSGYGSETIHTDVVVPSAGLDVSETVSDLTPETTYHYRLCWDTRLANLPVGCGEDRVVGQVSVFGEEVIITGGSGNPVVTRETFAVSAVGDEPGPGDAEGTVLEAFQATFIPRSEVFIDQHTTSVVECLRVAGNIAVVGWDDPPNDVRRFVAIEDNGNSGDRFLRFAGPTGSPCPEPSPSLLGSATASGNWTIERL